MARRMDFTTETPDCCEIGDVLDERFKYITLEFDDMEVDGL